MPRRFVGASGNFNCCHASRSSFAAHRHVSGFSNYAHVVTLRHDYGSVFGVVCVGENVPGLRADALREPRK